MDNSKLDGIEEGCGKMQVQVLNQESRMHDFQLELNALEARLEKMENKDG